MDLKSLLWYGVLTSITAAYLVAMAVVRSAKQHEVSHYARHMIVACASVWIRLVAYVLKQVLFGRERFAASDRHDWSLSPPLFSVHMALAVTTISLGGYNLYMGFQRIRHGSVGATSSSFSHQLRRMCEKLDWRKGTTKNSKFWVRSCENLELRTSNPYPSHGILSLLTDLTS